MSDGDVRTHEVTFCSRVSKWADSIFGSHADLPFKRTEIEQSKGIKRKRSDLRVYGDGEKLILAGEVKLPGTPEGRNPYDADLVEDAFRKAAGAGAQFFFTWNVNKLVLFDSKLWELPLYERRVKDYDLGLDLDSPDDVSRAEVEARIQAFLLEFFSELRDIAAGKKLDWGLPPDAFFIRAFESHIGWPVKLTAEHLWAQADASKTFDARLQEWMTNEQNWIVIRSQPKEWRALVDRAARTLCYVFANRLLFYESCRKRFTALKELSIPATAKAGEHLYEHFQKAFQVAVKETGDYETLFYPYEKDWAGPQIFSHKDSPDAWRSVLQNLHPFNFTLIPTDILGGIFKGLIAPEERHKFGQHYTNEDLVDVVNAFCIRSATDSVLDPACGSGSFLVRAYQRKAHLDPSRPHQQRIAEIFGADISLFAAHLSTLNLAARDINDEENYPRIKRGNWFAVASAVWNKKAFCNLPTGLREERKPGPVMLPKLNAIIGNPPYVRQELIPKRGKDVAPMAAKEDLQEFCAALWPNLDLGGRSDFHCYFWPTTTRFLNEGGWFGFLVSSSWLDAEYGFRLQEWVLSNFKIHAVLESNAEPWFEDARVKTCAVILQRCSDRTARDSQLVKFVRLDVPLAQILGEREDESARQAASEKFRDGITRYKESKSRPGFRIIVKQQKELWEDGLRAGRLFEMQKQRNFAEGVDAQGAGDDDDESGEETGEVAASGFAVISSAGYGAGKWGRYLRAPDIFFTIMEQFGKRFVPLGEITGIRRGITSGCDAFFMPRDASQEFLNKYTAEDWNDAPLHTSCKRSEVETGKVKLVLAGNGTVHPIESQYLLPEVHSPMVIDRPLVRAATVDRLILQVGEAMEDLKGTYVQKYLRYGERTTFASKKSKAVPVSKRGSCASRQLWYDLTKAKPGAMLWPMIQQYRHVIPANPEGLICNKRLFDIHPFELSEDQTAALQVILNSTAVGLFKFYFGKYAGTEGAMDTDVIDVNLLEVPDPRHATAKVVKKLRDAFDRLCQREARGMVEEDFMECRSPERAKKLAEKPISLPIELTMQDRRDLDLAVFELLGVDDAKERERLCDELYLETARHFRHIRIVEIQKQEQRTTTEGREFRTEELAADLWDALPEDEKKPLAVWMAAEVKDASPVVIPEGQPHLPDASDMFGANTVNFRQAKGSKAVPVELPSRPHAEIVFDLSHNGIHGELALPKTEKAAKALRDALAARLASIAEHAAKLANSRTSDPKRAADLAGLLSHWMIYGKPLRNAD